MLYCRHFTIRGAEGTDFAGGVYHGRILLPPEYPFKPPHILFLTPSGRFETNTKVCLSFSAYHPELWQPAWGIRLILEALISFLPTPADGAIGALDWSPQERKRLAVQSQHWECACCGKIINLLPKRKEGSSAGGEGGRTISRFQKEIEELQRLQQLEHKKDDQENIAEQAETTVAEEEKVETAKVLEPSESKQPSQPTPAGTLAPISSAPDEETEIIFEPALTTEEEEGMHQSFSEAAWKETSEHHDEQDDDDSHGDHDDDLQYSTDDSILDARTPLLSSSQQQQQLSLDQPSSSHLAHAVSAASDELLTQQQQQQPDDGESSWLSDPLLHGITLILSIIAYLLLRKIQAIVAEIRELE